MQVAHEKQNNKKSDAANKIVHKTLTSQYRMN